MPATVSKPAERFGVLELPVGGKHGYVGVRKVRKERFQGYTPKKRPGHTTKDYTTAHRAAVALALLKEDIRCGVVDSAKAKRAWHGSSASAPALPNALPSLAPVFLLTARVRCRFSHTHTEHHRHSVREDGERDRPGAAQPQPRAAAAMWSGGGAAADARAGSAAAGARLCPCACHMGVRLTDDYTGVFEHHPS